MGLSLIYGVHQYNFILLLTDHEREQLKAQHRMEPDGRICNRIKAVLLRDKGWSC
ncbi:hypothetical protein SCG7086_AG_00240 [Chlamydiales bacterium SCGC AG-110-P3]|nr:hypothetical protein SCG7086_AG_00240 [Chlamydiales bacterium SCGC AG-110-P3]